MPSPREHLATAPYEFDFFQAVRILERINPKARTVGLDAAPAQEIIRFRSHLSLAFPPSTIFSIEPPDEFRPIQLMTVTFIGLYGSNGVLPTHYTQMMMDHQRDIRGPERRSLRDWMDLFNHRIISIFYRAWEKYRFHIKYERGEAFRPTPDTFTLAIQSLMGLGTKGHQKRLRVIVPHVPKTFDEPPVKTLARVDDIALLYYAGLFVQRPRNPANLRAIIADYFNVPVEFQPFRGQWLPLSEGNQTCLGERGFLGQSTVAGSRVWDVQSRFRLRVGPLSYRQFEQLIPDPTPIEERKSFFLLAQLARLYAGAEYDFDVQLVLKAKEVPELVLQVDGAGALLGWNTWLISCTPGHDPDDAVFEACCTETMAAGGL